MIAAQYFMNTELDTHGRRTPETRPDAACYSLTIFTQRWSDVRKFYVEVLGAKIVSERTHRYCDMVLGGLPICLRPCDFGETVSYFHIYLAMRNKEEVLEGLRQRGIIITTEGPYTNFRDPEGRVFKLSDHEAIVA